jgi:hypothetical protein
MTVLADGLASFAEAAGLPKEGLKKFTRITLER